MFFSFPNMHVPVQGMDEIRLPQMVPIRQLYDRSYIQDPSGEIVRQMDQIFPERSRFSGKRIAVTVGSRGIPGLAGMVKGICSTLQAWGAEPFIVPAMGSHGGARAEGQLELITGYGITEEAIGAPIRTSMAVVQYGKLEGIPLYCDKLAFQSDGIVIFNKVKPHTDFRGTHESGLSKMIAIGLGNHKGASCFHNAGFQRFPELLPKAAQTLVDTGKVAFGVGVVQNTYDRISDIRVCPPEHLVPTDAELLRIAKQKLPQFKFDNINLLIVDEMGKNISGTGIDPNVVGRNLSNTFHNTLKLDKLFVRRLTPESHHSGVGLGMVDITTRACLNEVDWETTWANVMTTGSMAGGRIPMYANTDEDAIRLCLRSICPRGAETARVARIRNTLCMEEIQVSTTISRDLENHPEVEIIGAPAPMEFGPNGDLV